MKLSDRIFECSSYRPSESTMLRFAKDAKKLEDKVDELTGDLLFLKALELADVYKWNGYNDALQIFKQLEKKQNESK